MPVMLEQFVCPATAGGAGKTEFVLKQQLHVTCRVLRIWENVKLQSALQEMQQQFKDTRAILMKEQEAAKRAAEEAPVIQEVPIIDTALTEKLTAENEKLKALVSSLETKIGETEEKFKEASIVSEERLRKVVEAESKIAQLNNNMQRLQERLSDMDLENQVLRQQTLLNSPVKRMSEHLSIPTTLTKENLDNGHHDFAESKALNEPQSAPATMKDLILRSNMHVLSSYVLFVIT